MCSESDVIVNGFESCRQCVFGPDILSTNRLPRLFLLIYLPASFGHETMRCCCREDEDRLVTTVTHNIDTHSGGVKRNRPYVLEGWCGGTRGENVKCIKQLTALVLVKALIVGYVTVRS